MLERDAGGRSPERDSERGVPGEKKITETDLWVFFREALLDIFGGSGPEIGRCVTARFGSV
jgi:hypothetical protein